MVIARNSYTVIFIIANNLKGYLSIINPQNNRENPLANEEILATNAKNLSLSMNLIP